MSKTLNEAIAKVERNIGTIKERLTSASNLGKIGAFTVEGIFNRTKAGSSVEKYEGEKTPLAVLQESYKAQRRGRLSGILDGSTRPAKSNLTLTGSMLRDLTYRLNDNVIVLFFKAPFSAQKAKWAAEGSKVREKRPFLNLSYTEVKRIKDFLKAELKKLIAEIL